jgi:hypothetical protein
MDACRRLILILCIAPAGCVMAAPTGGDPAPDPGEVAFELVGPGGAALVVPVQINDRGPYPLVLDTGATVTCVDESLATELGLPDASGMVGVGGGIGGSLGQMRLLSVDSVAVGAAVVRDLQACTLDLSAMQQVGVEIRGLLGLNFLRNYRLTVDFADRTVRLDPP